MRWYQRKVTRRDKRIACDIAASFGINWVKFHDDKMYDYFDISRNGSHVIGLSTERSRRWFYSALLHEINHSLCARERIFPAYHFIGRLADLTDKQRLAIKRTALRAELYVDRRAEMMCHKLFHGLPYQRAYRCQEDRKSLQDYWRNR